MGCCGCVYSITVVGNMLSSGNLKKALLLIGDTATRMGSPYDKSRVPLFRGIAGLPWHLNIMRMQNPLLSISIPSAKDTGHWWLRPEVRHPVTPESFEYEDFGNGIVRAPVHTLINGMDVLSFAISKPPKSIDELLKYCALDKEKDIDYFLIHQANKLIIDRIVKKLKLETAKVPWISGISVIWVVLPFPCWWLPIWKSNCRTGSCHFCARHSVSDSHGEPCFWKQNRWLYVTWLKLNVPPDCKS